MAMIWCVPPIMRYTDVALPRMIQANLDVSRFVWDKWNYFMLAGVVVLVLIEWQSKKWAAQRRVALGLAAFVINFSFMVSLFLFFITAALLLTTIRHSAR